MQGEIKTTLRRAAALVAVLSLGMPAVASVDPGRDRPGPSPHEPVIGHSNQGGGPQQAHSNQGHGDPGWGAPQQPYGRRGHPGFPGMTDEDNQELSGGGQGGPFDSARIRRMDLELGGGPVAPDPALGRPMRSHADPLSVGDTAPFGITTDMGSGAITLPGDHPLHAVPSPGALPLLLLAAVVARRRRRRDPA